MSRFETLRKALTTMSNEPKQRNRDEERDLFNIYNEFAKSLRTWFIAYGIGGPVLLLTNEAVQSKIANSGFARCIGLAFLIGVALQVLLALLDKNALWGCYMAERHPDRRKKRGYRVAKWVAYAFWPEFLLDFLSLVFFACATYRVFIILTAPACLRSPLL
jgi:hypothetical protein